MSKIPKNLQYTSKVESAGARALRSNIAPQNGTSGYNLGDTIIFNVPTRANLVNVPTENYLKFDFNLYNNSGAPSTYRWDSCGAHGLIQRIRIYHGSNLLEDIDNYGLMAKMLFDLQMPTDSCYGKNNILCGTRNDLVCVTPAAISAITYLSAIQTNSGETVAQSLATATGATSRTYCLNLISLIGSLCQNNYLPLFAMTSAPLRVEITLVDSLVKALNCTSAGTQTTGGLTQAPFNIANCELVCNMIELSDEAMGMVSSGLQGNPLQFCFNQYRNYQTTLAVTNATTTQANFSIPAKFSSLKSLFVTQRDKGTGAVTFFPFSSVANGILSYYFRVGAQILPPKYPTKLPEMFAEVLKTVGSIADLNHQPSIDLSSYQLTTSPALAIATDAGYNASSSGSFYIGLDLENYSSASKDSIFAGYNTNSDDIFCVVDFVSQFTGTLRFDAFAMYDCLLVCKDGVAYITF